MDSQTIASIGSQTAAVQTSARPQTAAPARTTGAPTDPKQDDKATTGDDTPVRTRDPRSLQFQVDGATQQVVTKIVDENNRIVIRQIPDAEILRIAQAIDRMKGFLLEGKG